MDTNCVSYVRANDRKSLVELMAHRLRSKYPDIPLGGVREAVEQLLDLIDEFGFEVAKKQERIA